MPFSNLVICTQKQKFKKKNIEIFSVVCFGVFLWVVCVIYLFYLVGGVGCVVGFGVVFW